MNKLNVESVKAVMKTMNVSLSDLVENDELIGLLRERALSGELTKGEILSLADELPAVQQGKAPETDDSTTCKLLHFAVHGATCLEYALNGGDVIGPVVKGKQLRFVLSLKNSATNLDIFKAKEMAKKLELVNGIEWIVPNDNHFRVILNNIGAINRFLEAYDGDKIGSIPFLSETSQVNPPRKWNVRFILPLPLEI